MDLDFIRAALQAQDYLITRHAPTAMAERGITTEQIEQSVEFGEIIEREPGDEPYPPVLVLGWLVSGDPLHVKFSRASATPSLRIVTTYQPEETEWESDFKARKPRE